MEKHPLESWYLLVHSTLHPAELVQPAPDVINAYLAIAKELKEALQLQLLRDTLYLKTEKETELLVERYQVQTTTLLNQLLYYQQDASITPDLKQLYQSVATALEAVLLFLQTSYGRFVNLDLYLPLNLRIREGHELKKQWKIIANFLSESRTHASLLLILDQTIKVLIRPDQKTSISYRQLSYLKNLLEDISGYLSTTTPPSAYASLTELLIIRKFNDLLFIREVCQDIRKEAEQKESDELRVEFLRTSRKQLGQVFEQNHTAFHAGLPTAKQAIMDWIGQELASVEVNLTLPDKKDEQEGVKMHTSLSVPTLALIARLFKDSGMITNSNHTEILKFFTQHFTNQQKSAFSYDHLRTRYYQVEEGTKKKVYDYLMVMAQLCKKL